MGLFLGRGQTEKFVTDKNSCVQRFFVVWPWVRVVSLAWRCAVTWHPCHHYILDPHINSAREGQINGGRSCVYVTFNVRERKKERFMCVWSVWRSGVCVRACADVSVSVFVWRSGCQQEIAYGWPGLSTYPKSRRISAREGSDEIPCGFCFTQ